MPISNAGGVLLTMALFVSACSRPVVPGVLTLAPAGMRISGTCTAHPNGTLTMGADCGAEAEAYVDAGTVTITVTARSAAPDHPMSIELWFAGASIGSRRVESAAGTALPFHARARASGPIALRLTAHADTAGAPAVSAVEVEKVVITEP